MLFQEAASSVNSSDHGNSMNAAGGTDTAEFLLGSLIVQGIHPETRCRMLTEKVNGMAAGIASGLYGNV